MVLMQAFSFGTVVADLAQGEGTAPPSVANLKISNVSKVACDVDLSVKPTDKAAAQERCAFAVQPATLAIPALEYRYVQVSFQPRQIDSFVAALEARVRNGEGCPSTHRFACELRVRSFRHKSSVRACGVVGAAAPLCHAQHVELVAWMHCAVSFCRFRPALSHAGPRRHPGAERHRAAGACC